MANHYARTDSGYPSIDPGDLRHYITYLSQATATDASGVTTVWVAASPPLTSWAKIDIVRARDLIQGGQQISQVVAVVTTRWELGIEPSARFVDENGAYWIIEAINNVGGRNVILEMSCLGLGNNNS